MDNKTIFSECVSSGENAIRSDDPIVSILSRPIVPKKVEFVNIDVFVCVKPATSSFARWVKKFGFGQKNPNGGLLIPIKWAGESIYNKLEFANAFSDTLKTHGIDSYVELKSKHKTNE